MTPDEALCARERTFHDDWAQSIAPESVLVRESFEACTAPENRWILSELGDVKGKRVLELGSGAGEGAVYFALLGADVVATDLSPGMLNVVDRVAANHGTRVSTLVQSADNLSACEDSSFDVVYGANLLHHVDIERCLNEVWRVLRPGGLAAFWDPIAYNPVINIYRRMARSVRTEDEHPIRMQDMAQLRRRFSLVRCRFFWLSSLIVFFKFFLVDKVDPAADRYWKRIIVREAELRWLVRPLQRLDAAVLRLVPALGWMCWNVAVVVRK